MTTRWARQGLGFALLVGVGLTTTARAQTPAFELPVACAMGEDCFIQNYVDQDPGPGASDYTCGTLAYDGDRGTDFRVRDYVAMEEGVAVTAAAAGAVLRTRDGVADVNLREIGADAVAGKEAGNAVIIDHGGGWETQYSHLRQGSVAVAPGQRVEVGDRLGLIGLSGNTEFPHVEFAVRHGGEPVDPFVGLAPGTGCGRPAESLWSVAAQSQLAYVSTTLLGAGFAAEAPDAERARHGAYRGELTVAAEALVFWIDVIGTRAGDVEEITLSGPGGRLIAEAREVHERARAAWFRFAGGRRPGTAWPEGVYRGRYLLTREVEGATVTVVEVTREVPLD